METRPARFHDLPLAGQLVVWASRHWLRAYADGRMIPRCVWQSFAHADLATAYRSLTDALAVLAGHEIEPGIFLPPNAPSLAGAEARWVRLVLTGDRTCWPSAKEPCPAVMRVLLQHLQVVEQSFLKAGFNLDLSGLALVSPPPGAMASGPLVPAAAAVH